LDSDGTDHGDAEGEDQRSGECGEREGGALFYLDVVRGPLAVNSTTFVQGFSLGQVSSGTVDY
jgi:hypothetical protein